MRAGSSRRKFLAVWYICVLIPYTCTQNMYTCLFPLVGAQNRRADSEPRSSEATSNDLSPSNAIANGNRTADSASNEDVYSSSCNEEAPEDDEDNKPAISRQGTFSKEGEREDGDEDTVPRSRYVIMTRGRSRGVMAHMI